MTDVFNAIKPKKISEEIVEQLRSHIFQGKLKPGERLPPERELAKLLNVSRASLREALNILQGMGLLEIQQGNRSFVRPITTRSVQDPLMAFLKASESNVFKLLEIRKYLEIGSVSLATERATPSEIQKLQKILEVMEEDINRNRLGAKADIEFHITIAETTRNQLYMHLMHTIYDLLQDKIRNAWGGVFRKKNRRMKLLKQHMGIMTAIKKRDRLMGIERAMIHFDYVEENWKEKS